MKAVICTKYGLPEVLIIQDVPKPIAKSNEILVKIVAASVNSGDVRVRGLAVKGFMKIIMRFAIGFHKPRKPILGTVFSGIVETLGSNVTKYKVGDKVFGMTGFNFGTHAEYIAVKENSSVLTMPKNATFDQAAALIFGGQTAIFFLERLRIQKLKKPTILIIGATGAVGTAAIQIAQYYGADITAVCSSHGKSLVESLGISKIMLYDEEDFSMQKTSYDIIFDAVGKTTRKQCKGLLAKGGLYETVGGLTYASETQGQLSFLRYLFEKNKLKAIIDKIFTINEIAIAHQYVESGRKKGNVVLKISDE